MLEVIVIVEGETEEAFIKTVVAPKFKPACVFVKPVLPQDKKNGAAKKGGAEAKGGAVTIDRFKDKAVKLLKAGKVVSSFIDLYALNPNFPGFAHASSLSDVYSRVKHLERELHTLVVREAKCRPERFIPHIQPYEFEALLFSDVDALCALEPGWGQFAPELNQMRLECDSPEHINDSFETAPSRRLQNLLKPKYQKTRHGPLIAERITLPVIERECLHFRNWMDALRKLGQP